MVMAGLCSFLWGWYNMEFLLFDCSEIGFLVNLVFWQWFLVGLGLLSESLVCFSSGFVWLIGLVVS